MTIVQPTLYRATRLWWSIAWRSLAFGLAGGVVAGVVMGFIAYFAGLSDETVQEWARMVALFIGTPACIYAAYSRIGKACGDFRLVLVSLDDSSAA